jgi:hypothetical protein
MIAPRETENIRLEIRFSPALVNFPTDFVTLVGIAEEPKQNYNPALRLSIYHFISLSFAARLCPISARLCGKLAERPTPTENFDVFVCQLGRGGQVERENLRKRLHESRQDRRPQTPL